MQFDQLNRWVLRSIKIGAKHREREAKGEERKIETELNKKRSEKEINTNQWKRKTPKKLCQEKYSEEMSFAIHLMLGLVGRETWWNWSDD